MSECNFSNVPFNCPCEISSQGTYTLLADTICNTPDAAITVTTNGVNIDLGGFTLGTTATGDDRLEFGISLEEGLTGGSVSNGVIEGFVSGISGSALSSYIFEDLIFSKNEIAIFLEDDVDSPSGGPITIRDNVFNVGLSGDASAGSVGIDLSSMVGASISNNVFTIVSAENLGITMEGGSDIRLNSNIFFFPSEGVQDSAADFSVAVEISENFDSIITNNCFFGPSNPRIGSGAVLDKTIGVNVENTDDGDVSTFTTISNNFFNTLETGVKIVTDSAPQVDDNCFSYDEVAIKLGVTGTPSTVNVSDMGDNAFFNNDVDVDADGTLVVSDPVSMSGKGSKAPKATKAPTSNSRVRRVLGKGSKNSMGYCSCPLLANSGTKAPKASKAPGATKAPKASKAPGATKAPKGTKSPSGRRA